ncbi:MAG TPA: hypothetical protein VGN90_11170 [Pyrinomonadaceae bacterium]|jgi:hypothetical protein|nr:hypothetical protein [Pyrinomonadaceae bacterium]
MHEGAFALIDCLGFKGIWKRTDPFLLVQKLSKIEQTVYAQIHKDAFNHFSFGPIKISVQLLSDTVAISLQYQPKSNETPESWQKNYLVMVICLSVIQVLDLFLEGDPPLVMRGCISYGEHLSEGNFIAGPAVDEAAEHMNVAEGAFVWLLPSAEDMYLRGVARSIALFQVVPPAIIVESWKSMQERGINNMEWAANAVEEHGAEAIVESVASTLVPLLTAPVVIAPYDMPLKTGACLRCAVVNPLFFQKSEEQRRKIIETYSKTIVGNRLDIWLKNQHTVDFLEVANRACGLFAEHIESAKSNGPKSPTT